MFIFASPGLSKSATTSRFRDFLRRDPAVAAEYAALKREPAAAHDGLTLESQERYSLSKTEFVRSVLARAFAERKQVMRYALDGLFIAVALWLAGIFVYLLAEFSAMTEPEEFGPHVLIFGGALGIISQAGLLFLPWARRGARVARGLCLLLMVPAGLGLAVMFGEGLMRHYRGNPIKTEAFLNFALGFGAYLIGAVVLIRGRAE
jgi:hypothetical protein